MDLFTAIEPDDAIARLATDAWPIIAGALGLYSGGGWYLAISKATLIYGLGVLAFQLPATSDFNWSASVHGLAAMWAGLTLTSWMASKRELTHLH